MANDSSFKMSQDYELIPPKKQSAYPILVEEWTYLKDKIRKIRDNANIYHTIGSVLLGIAGSAFVAALTLELPKREGEVSPIVIAWFIFFGALICGMLSLYFAKDQRKIQSTSAADVIEHMELIEKRYEV